MASPAPSVHSDVREPTSEQLQGFESIEDLFAWAKAKGRLDWPGSKAGSLLRVVAGDEWDDVEIDDFASVAPVTYERLHDRWRYSDVEPDGSDGSMVTLDTCRF